MDDEPKTIWRKSWKGRSNFRPWLILTGATFLILLVTTLLVPGAPRFSEDWAVELSATAAASLFVATVFLGGCALVRWLFCWRNFRRALLGFGCLVVLIALFYAEEDWRGWHTWNRFKKEWEAKGEHFNLASYAPPTVPDDQNFAMAPIALTSYERVLTRDGRVVPEGERGPEVVRRMEMTLTCGGDGPTNCGGDRVKGTLTKLEYWQAYYRELATRTNFFPVAARRQSPAADVLLALSRYDSVIEELRVACRRPSSRFPLNYDSEMPIFILLPHLAPLKSCARVLELRSVAELQNHQPERALDDVRLALDLTSKIRNEPVMISQLVRIAMVHLTLQPVWEGLAEHRWSDAQLITLDTEMEKLDFVADFRLALHGELGSQCETMQTLIRNSAGIEPLIDPGSDRDNPAAILTRLGPKGWFYQNEYRCARIMEEYSIPIADVSHGTFSPKLARQASAQLEAEIEHPTLFTWYEAIVQSGYSMAAMRFAYAQSSVDLARTALALERYRLAHGEFPESTDALAPQFIAKIPDDVIGGGPLKYRREPGGLFTLYSVGWNEKDDGGVVAFNKDGPDYQDGDWVWRYPTGLVHIDVTVPSGPDGVGPRRSRLTPQSAL